MLKYGLWVPVRRECTLGGGLGDELRFFFLRKVYTEWPSKCTYVFGPMFNSNSLQKRGCLGSLKYPKRAGLNLSSDAVQKRLDAASGCKIKTPSWNRKGCSQDR